MPEATAPGLAIDYDCLATWASELKISEHAISLYLGCDVIDLHVDSYIWTRCFGYRLDRRHGAGWLGARFCSQVDIPRIREARIGGATWVITTNPLRTQRSRARVLAKNLQQLSATLASQSRHVRLARTYSDYDAARRAGLHAAFLGIQGANAIEDPSCWDSIVDQRFLRITLMHLTNSAIGQSSTPLRHGTDRGLSIKGHELVEFLNSKKIFVDLAHASEKTFYDVLAHHSRDIPPIVTHTGVSAVHRHWRNLTDEQLHAIADRGGVIGIFYHSPFLTRGPRRCLSGTVAKHIAHAVRTVGACHVALGSDWDGNIITPKDMPTCLELPRLVQAMLDEDMTDDEIQWVLGRSFLRLLQSTRP